MKTLLSLFSVILLSGCATNTYKHDDFVINYTEKPTKEIIKVNNTIEDWEITEEPEDYDQVLPPKPKTKETTKQPVINQQEPVHTIRIDFIDVIILILLITLLLTFRKK